MIQNMSFETKEAAIQNLPRPELFHNGTWKHGGVAQFDDPNLPIAQDKWFNWYTNSKHQFYKLLNNKNYPNGKKNVIVLFRNGKVVKQK
jgi:hypothetical protein